MQYMTQFMGYGNPAPWAAYSQSPGIPGGTANPMQAAQWSGMNNPSNGAQSSQFPFNLGGLGGMLQLGLMGPVARALGIPDNVFRSLPFQGSGNHSMYEYVRSSAIGAVENSMVMGTFGQFGPQFPGDPGRAIGLADPGAAKFGTGMLGTIARGFVQGDINNAARIGMREYAPQMFGMSALQKGESVYASLSGLARAYSGSNGFMDKTISFGSGMSDIMEGMGRSSRFGIQGFTAKDLEDLRSSDQPTGQRVINRSRSMADMVAAGRGVYGQGASASNILSGLQEMFGEGVTSAADGAKRLREVGAMAEMANVDAKFVAQYIKVMRKMGENMGMSGQTAADYAIKTVEGAILTQASALKGGNAMTMDRAMSISNSTYAGTQGSTGVMILDAMQYSMAKYSTVDQAGIKIAGVGSMSLVNQKIKDLYSRDPGVSSGAKEWLMKNQSVISKDAHFGSMREYMFQSPEQQAQTLDMNGLTSVITATAGSLGFDPMENLMFSQTSKIKNRAQLYALKDVLSKKGGFVKNLEEEMGIHPDKFKDFGWGKGDISALASDIRRMSLVFGKNSGAGMKRIIKMSQYEDNIERHKEQTQNTIETSLLDTVGGGSAIGLFNPEFLINMLKSDDRMKEIGEQLTKDGVITDGVIDTAKFDAWKKKSANNRTAGGALVAGLISAGKDALKRGSKLSAMQLASDIAEGKEIGKVGNRWLTLKSFSEEYEDAAGDSDKREKMRNEFLKSVNGQYNDGAPLNEQAKKAISEAIKEDAAGSDAAGAETAGDVLTKELTKVIDAMKGPITEVSTVLVQISDYLGEILHGPSKTGTGDSKTDTGP